MHQLSFFKPSKVLNFDKIKGFAQLDILSMLSIMCKLFESLDVLFMKYQNLR
jgi:hypothetical protein